MAAPGGGVSWDVVREFVRQESERTSQNVVAREIGVGAPTLLNFLEGATPRSRVGRKLRVWYARVAVRNRYLHPALAEDVVSLLCSGLTDGNRARFLRAVVERLTALHREQRTPPPEWLRHVAPPGAAGEPGPDPHS